MASQPRPARKAFRQETVIHSFFLRPVAWEIVRALWYLPVHPNHVTIFRIFLNIGALVLFAFGDYRLYLIGVATYVAHEILDHVDGMMARSKGLSSQLGATLEILADVLFSNGSSFLGFAIAFGAFQASGDPMILLLYAFIAAAAECSSVFDRYRNQVTDGTLHLNHDKEAYLDIFVANPIVMIKNVAKTARKFRNYILIVGGAISYAYPQPMALDIMLLAFGAYAALELVRLTRSIAILMGKK